MNLTTLGHDPLLCILLACPVESILTLRQTHSNIRKVTDDPFLWRQLLDRDYPGLAIDKSLSYRDNYRNFSIRAARYVPVNYRGTEIFRYIWIFRDEAIMDVYERVAAIFSRMYPDIVRFTITLMVPADQRKEIKPYKAFYYEQILLGITTVGYYEYFGSFSEIRVDGYYESRHVHLYPEDLSSSLNE